MEESEVARDLTCGGAGRWLFNVAWLAVAVGAFWEAALYWLWIPAFLAAGAGCLWNILRCGRVHCFLTGPLYVAAAAYLGAARLGVVPLRPLVLLVVVFGLSLLARLAERRLGRYLGAHP